MTSPINDSETKAFFKEHNYFGINENKVHFFSQGMLPAIDTEGRIILEGKGKINLSPNGNGGIFAYLLEKDSTLFPGMLKSGIEYLHIIGIDNILNRIMDPMQIGLCINKKVGAIIKTLPKNAYNERVGIFARVNKKGYDMVEYSEISEEMAKRTNDKGELLFNHGKEIFNYRKYIKLSCFSEGFDYCIYNL